MNNFADVEYFISFKKVKDSRIRFSHGVKSLSREEVVELAIGHFHFSRKFMCSLFINKPAEIYRKGASYTLVNEQPVN